jgi:hypothetical protein
MIVIPDKTSILPRIVWRMIPSWFLKSNSSKGLPGWAWRT